MDCVALEGRDSLLSSLKWNRESEKGESAAVIATVQSIKVCVFV